jgi:hypothetical protein
MASIRASRGNFAEKHHASSNTCSPPAFRISVFENQFSHGLLETGLEGKADRWLGESWFSGPDLSPKRTCRRFAGQTSQVARFRLGG